MDILTNAVFVGVEFLFVLRICQHTVDVSIQFISSEFQMKCFRFERLWWESNEHFFLLTFDFYCFRFRGIVYGIETALNYLFSFITKKTYYNLESTLSLSGTALSYCIVCGNGLIFTYNVLTETENRSIEEIELHFDDSSKNLCERNILFVNSIWLTVCSNCSEVIQI